MKWWAQSFLIGIPKIVCGFRDNEGIVQHLQTFKTVDIPRESQVTFTERATFCFVYLHLSSCVKLMQSSSFPLQSDLSLWQGNVCLNFLDELLKWMKETIVKDSPQYVTGLQYNNNHPFL